MNTALTLAGYTQGQLLGSRQRGLGLRQELEGLLDQQPHVTIDFTGMNATQSFVDELIGVLVYHYGPDFLKRLSFKGCSDDVRTVIRLVVQERVKDYRARHHQKH